MPWLDGQPLNRAVEARLSDPKQLANLERRFIDLVLELRTLGIAHGDLQHGNILVDRSGDLYLVDYDGMFVPALRGMVASESGDPNYQHPRRTSQFDAELDRFAAIVIVVALRALAAEPRLWRTYNTDDNLLFRRTDFADPNRSPLFRDLATLSATREIADRLRLTCQGDYVHVPLLEDALDGASVRPLPIPLIKPAHVVVLNRLFGKPAPVRRRAAPSGPRSWKLRRAVAQLAVAFSADGKLVASADADAKVWVRDATTGRTRYTLHLPRLAGRIGAVAFDPSGRVIAAVAHGSSVSIWDVTSGSWTRELRLTRGEVRFLALSADAHYVVAAADDGMLRCWSLSSGTLIGACGQAAPIKALTISRDGRSMAAVGATPGVQLWELPAGRQLGSLTTGAAVLRTAYGFDSSTLTVVRSGGRLSVWDVAARQIQNEIALATGRIVGLAPAPDGQRVAFVSQDGSIGVRVLSGRPQTRAPRRRGVAASSPRAADWLRDILRRVAAGASLF